MIKKLCFVYAIAIFCLLSCGKKIIVEDISGQKMTKINTTKDKDKHLILDVRDNASYKKGHLDFALNIPLEDLSDRVGEIVDLKNLPIYIYADTADDSFPASQVLVENGFEHIFNAEGINEYSYELVKYNVIRVHDVRHRPDSSSFFLIDYRTPSSYQMEHFRGAINIPVGEIPNKMNLLPKNKNRPIVFYCNTGTTSAWGARELIDLGYTNVYVVLEGAISEVFEKELSLENVKED